MNNFEKLKKAVDDLLEVMQCQEDDVNLLIFKVIFQQYGIKNNIKPLQLSKDLLTEFLHNGIDKKYHGGKVQIKEDKKVEEEVKEEKLYTNSTEAYRDYFREWFVSTKKNDDELIFYKYINREIWAPFIKSHNLNLPHKYAPQQTKI